MIDNKGKEIAEILSNKLNNVDDSNRAVTKADSEISYLQLANDNIEFINEIQWYWTRTPFGPSGSDFQVFILDHSHAGVLSSTTNVLGDSGSNYYTYLNYKSWLPSHRYTYIFVDDKNDPNMTAEEVTGSYLMIRGKPDYSLNKIKAKIEFSDYNERYYKLLNIFQSSYGTAIGVKNNIVTTLKNMRDKFVYILNNIFAPKSLYLESTYGIEKYMGDEEWVLGSKPNIEIVKAGYATFNGEHYIFGGSTSTGYVGSIYKSDNGSVWSPIRSLGNPRIRPAVGIYNGSLWMIGGLDENGSALNDFIVTSNGSDWVTGSTDLPPKADFSIVEFEDYFCTLGGWNGSSYDNGFYVSDNGSHWILWSTSDVFKRRGYLMDSFSNIYINGSFYRSILFFLGGIDYNGDYQVVEYYRTSLASDWQSFVPNVYVYKHPAKTRIGSSLFIFGNTLDDYRGAPNDIWQTLNGIEWILHPTGSEFTPRSDSMMFNRGIPVIINGLDSSHNIVNETLIYYGVSDSLELKPISKDVEDFGYGTYYKESVYYNGSYMVFGGGVFAAGSFDIINNPNLYISTNGSYFNSLSTISSEITVRMGAPISYLNGSIIMVGGRAGSPKYDIVHISNDGQSYTNLGNIGSHRVDFCGFDVHNGNLWVNTRTGSLLKISNSGSYAVYQSNLPIKSWNGLWSLAGSLYIFGGWSGTNDTNVVLRLDDENTGSVSLIGYAPWSAREGFAYFKINNVGVLIGGYKYITMQPVNDIWLTVNGSDWQQENLTVLGSIYYTSTAGNKIINGPYESLFRGILEYQFSLFRTPINLNIIAKLDQDAEIITLQDDYTYRKLYYEHPGMFKVKHRYTNGSIETFIGSCSEWVGSYFYLKYLSYIGSDGVGYVDLYCNDEHIYSGSSNQTGLDYLNVGKNTTKMIIGNDMVGSIDSVWFEEGVNVDSQIKEYYATSTLLYGYNPYKYATVTTNFYYGEKPYIEIGSEGTWKHVEDAVPSGVDELGSNIDVKISYPYSYPGFILFKSEIEEDRPWGWKIELER